MLIIICGLPGVGKSTVGKLLRKKLKQPEVETDKLKPTKVTDLELRKEIKRSVYNTLFVNGARKLSRERSTIMNATFFKKVFRTQADELAEKFGTKLYIIEVKCDEDITLKRIKNRYDKGESDVTARIYYIIKARFDKIKRKHFVIDNSKDIDHLKKQVDEAVKKLKA